ncbi:TPA: alpha-1,2-mannosidase, partial [Streptococcus pneumoniae]
LFDHLRVYLAKEDKWLDIHTKQNHNHFNFVKECRLNKTLVSTIQHQDLLKAEQLTFTLSWLPSH